MKKKSWLIVTLLFAFGACSINPTSQVKIITTPLSTETVTPTSTPVLDLPTSTPEQGNLPIVTQIATETIVGNATPPQGAYSGLITLPVTYRFIDGQYLDDRGSEYMFMISYFNAIRQNLLPMAYSFWNDNVNEAGSYDSFVQTYSDIKPDELTITKFGTSGAAGSIYATMALTLKGMKAAISSEWAGCYTLRTPNPSLFDSADYHNRHFVIGKLIEIPSGNTQAEALETACKDMEFGLLESVLPGPDGLGAIDPKHFVDSRSTPEGVISSFWNALNRQEYARAYNYFEAPAIFPGPYSTFKAGYLDTRNISGSIPPPEKLAATGNWYWRVPVLMKAETKNGVQQTFVGCYVIHQSDPALYVSPPFKPMGIQKAQFEALSTSADDKAIIQAALSSACDGLP